MTMTANTTVLSKTATKRDAARLKREINACQTQLTSLRSRADGGGGYGAVNGKPTQCQQLVDEMAAMTERRRMLLGEPL